MFCRRCGRENAEGAETCVFCTSPLNTTAPYVQTEPPKTSKLAIWSFVLGITGVVLSVAVVGFGFALAGIIVGIIALLQIGRSRGSLTGQGWAIAGISTSGCIFLLVPVIAAIMFPVFARAREAARASACQENMKELGTAIRMYTTDYDGLLPSSALCGGGNKWNSKSFIQFASGKGTFPPAKNDATKSWPELLYPYLRNKDSVSCPSDRRESNMASYFWKAAVDYAWFQGMKTDQAYAYPNNQVVMYEREGWHRGEQGRGFSNGVALNCLHMDGSVTASRIMNSGYDGLPSPGPLPPNGGEPAWYNFDWQTSVAAVGKFWNPKTCMDSLGSVRERPR